MKINNWIRLIVKSLQLFKDSQFGERKNNRITAQNQM